MDLMKNIFENNLKIKLKYTFIYTSFLLENIKYKQILEKVLNCRFIVLLIKN